LCLCYPGFVFAALFDHGHGVKDQELFQAKKKKCLGSVKPPTVKKFFKDYFIFNQVELKGIRFLLGIMVLLAAIYFLMPLFVGGNVPFDPSRYQAQVDSFVQSSTIDSTRDDERYSYKKYNSTGKKNFSENRGNDFDMKPFDPNGLPKEIWMQMGLSEKQAQVIKNYELKGGKFRTKEDVKKQFVITEEFFNKIEPFLVFAEINDEVNSEHSTLSVDINHAPREDWILLNGIGEKMADRIISYREKLGGFYSVEQLQEVYGLPETTFVKIKSHCFVTSYSLRKININLAEYKELHQHPYINDDLPAKIIDYRKKQGLFKNADDFKRSGLVDEGLYTKLVPYLSFSH
jgi:competence protein ComEA